MTQTLTQTFDGASMLFGIQWPGNASGTYSRPAIVNGQKSIDTTMSTNTDPVANVAYPLSPDIEFITPKSTKTTFTGSGMIDVGDLWNWTQFNMVGYALPVQVAVPSDSTGSNAIVYSGNMYLTKFTESAEPHKKGTHSFTLEAAQGVSVSQVSNGLASAWGWNVS